MAIEFRCPYCTATIRVADSAPGRVGKCPRCNTKMIVPQPSAALPPPISLGLGDSPDPTPPTASDDEPVLLEENDADIPEVHFAAEDAPVIAPIEPTPIALPTNLVPVIAPVGRRVVKKRRTGRKRPQVMWIVATVLGFGLTLGAGYVVWLQVFNGRLSGELIGTALEEVKLPPATIPRASLGMISSALDPVLADLEAQPVPLVSELMDVRIGAYKDGLAITIEQGAHTRWYRVDVKSHPGLAKFAGEQEKGFEAPRTKQIAQAAPAFVRDYLKVRKKEADSSVITPYRDSLALPSLVKGLGAHTVAVVGRIVYPCVYEQADGSLYFLLPAKLKSFTLEGKPNADGSRGAFTGEFRVVVKPDRSTPRETVPVEMPPIAKGTVPPDDTGMKEPSDETADDKPTDSKPKKKTKKNR